jgi:uncharacterized repeat protein (TIGR04052 family)
MRIGLMTCSLVTAVALVGCGDDAASDDETDDHTDTDEADHTDTEDDMIEIDAPVENDADSSPRSVTIHLRPTVGSAPFACGLQYVGQGSDGTTITPRDFRFYYYGAQLIAEGGARVPITLDQDGEWQVDNVGMIDFEDFTAGCQDGTPGTNTTIRGTVPPGNYTGLAFTIGVPEAMNHTELTAKPAPLNTTSLFWDWNFGHIFFAAVTSTDVTDPAPGVVSHYTHVGSTGCEGDASMGDTVTCSNPNRSEIVLEDFDVLERAVIVDYGAFLSGVPLSSSQGCHSFPAMPGNPDVCTNPFAKLGISFASGQPMAGQSVFRTEQ